MTLVESHSGIVCYDVVTQLNSWDVGPQRLKAILNTGSELRSVEGHSFSLVTEEREKTSTSQQPC